MALEEVKTNNITSQRTKVLNILQPMILQHCEEILHFTHTENNHHNVVSTLRLQLMIIVTLLIN